MYNVNNNNVDIYFTIQINYKTKIKVLIKKCNCVHYLKWINQIISHDKVGKTSNVKI